MNGKIEAMLWPGEMFRSAARPGMAKGTVATKADFVRKSRFSMDFYGASVKIRIFACALALFFVSPVLLASPSMREDHSDHRDNDVFQSCSNGLKTPPAWKPIISIAEPTHSLDTA
jgi:hypothetical protein